MIITDMEWNEALWKYAVFLILTPLIYASSLLLLSTSLVYPSFHHQGASVAVL